MNAQLKPLNLDSIVIERTGALWKHANLEMGITGLDAQHAWLVALILEMEWVLHHKPKNLQARFQKILKEARFYIKQHFEAEEKIFSELNYSDELHHKKGHDEFLKNLKYTMEKNTNLSPLDAEQIYLFMRNWLVQHILVEDRKYLDYFIRRKLLDQSNEIFNALNQKQKLLSVDKLEFLKLISQKNKNIIVTTPKILTKIKSIWDNLNLRLSVPIIDIQHTWLIKLIVDIDEAIDQSDLTRDAVLANTLDECIHYVDLHFRTEEALMELINYEDIENHKKTHKKFESFILKRKKDFEVEKGRLAVLIVKELREWLSNHISLEDKKFVNPYKKNREAVLGFSKKEITSGRAGIRDNQIELYKKIVLNE